MSVDAMPSSTERVSVLMISAGFYPKIGGTEKQAEELARSIQARGAKVRIMTLRLDSRAPLEEDLNGLRVSRIAYPRIRLIGTVVIMLKLGWRLLWERDRYDLIHVHMVEYLAFVAALVAPLIGKPVVLKFALRPSDSAGGFGDFPELVSRWPVLERVLRLGILRADRFIVISTMIEEMATGWGISRSNLVRIPNGVNVDVYRPASEEERLRLRDSLKLRSGPLVLYCGRLAPQKGVADLLAAWSAVGAERPEATLYLLGEGRLEESLKEEANRLGISRSVEFRGAVRNVSDYLRAADVFVLPSHYEGMPNALLEAMACGLPVVSTRVSGVLDVVRDGSNGLLVGPGQPKALAEALLRLMKDGEYARKLGGAARETVGRSYSLGSVADATVRLYDEILTAGN